MEISAAEPQSETEADRSPLLMERQVNRSDDEHIIDISRISNASSSLSHDDLPHEDRPSSSSHEVAYQTASSPNRANARNYSFTRRNEGYTRRSRSPLNSGLWISVELVVTLGQIIAAIVVLSLSTDENPQAPLVAWIVGYASGCVAMLPILYWRYRNRNRGNPSQSNRGSEEDTTRLRSSLSQNNLSSEPASSTAVSVTRPSEQQNQQTTILASTNGHISRILNTRLSGLVDHLKMALDCFFAVWFVVGNVWIFGGHSSPSDAPKLYRLCIVFLTFSCVGYAMPFILCATICCCLPCILSVLGFREDLPHTRGATPEYINSLPTYKFTLRKNSEYQEMNSGDGEGGLVAVGTEKERSISGEDAICCICLAKYADKDELKELPCTHLFHTDCIDKWLKINATCPLCKFELGEKSVPSPSTPDSSRRYRDRMSTGPGEGVYGHTVF